jgi:hypothetical protein
MSEKMARRFWNWLLSEITADGLWIEVFPTHHEMAQFIGASRENVTPVLGELRASN